MPEPVRPPRRLVFADTEYDRLNTDTANLVEVAYAVEDDPVVFGIPPHSTEGHDPKSLQINKYFERDLGDKARWARDILDRTARDTAGQTMVGANPRVDARVLSRFIGYEPWHYRLCDIESAAFLLLGFDQMPGLREIKDALTELGYDLPAPDHSAAGDVETLRAVFRTLQRIARHLLRNGLPTAQQLDNAELWAVRSNDDPPPPAGLGDAAGEL